MKILTEADLRSACLTGKVREYSVEPGTYVTPLAQEFLKDRKITLTEKKNVQEMPREPVVNRGAATYRDASTGITYAEKPEHMTHLRGNLLVEKIHPRIALRGALDSFQAELMETQFWLAEAGRTRIAEELEDILSYVRAILGAEVQDRSLEDQKLFEMDEEQIRDFSHHIPERLGIPHPVLNYRMGEPVLLLNRLRTQIRECELAAVSAFGSERQDLVQALNRLSSAIYILMCREIARQKEGKE